MQKHGSEGGSENPHFLLLEVEGEYTSTRASASTCTCSAGARVTDDGSLFLGTPSLSTRPAASQCQSGAGDSRGKKFEGSTCSAGARVTDDGSLCLGISRFGVLNSASHCELRHWKDPNSRPWATLCDNLCRSMEAGGDPKIHTFYCRRLKESTPASCHCLHSSLCSTTPHYAVFANPLLQ